MRIISGTHKGKKILIKENLPVRPTTDRAKEGIFNIIENRYYFNDKNVLDLFSGTGNISFEFGSRGAKEITSVDSNKNCIKSIEETNKILKYNISTLKLDTLDYLEKCDKQFNFIFADPPYKDEKYLDVVQLIKEKNLVKKNGLLIIEHDKNNKFYDENLELRKYGTTYFSIFSF